MWVAAALAYRWDGKRARLFFQTKPDSYNEDSLITFLKDLKREFREGSTFSFGMGCLGIRARR